MLKKILLSLTFSLLFILKSTNLYAATWDKDAILGTWLSPTKDGRILIEKNSGTYSGKLVWIIEKSRNKKDTKNPNQSKRERKLLGITLLSGFKFEKGKWVGGRVYDPKSGKTYSCKLSLKDKDTLKIRGYIGLPLFGRTEVFTRYKE